MACFSALNLPHWQNLPPESKAIEAIVIAGSFAVSLLGLARLTKEWKNLPKFKPPENPLKVLIGDVPDDQQPTYKHLLAKRLTEVLHLLPAPDVALLSDGLLHETVTHPTVSQPPLTTTSMLLIERAEAVIELVISFADPKVRADKDSYFGRRDALKILECIFLNPPGSWRALSLTKEELFLLSRVVFFDSIKEMSPEVLFRLITVLQTMLNSYLQTLNNNVQSAEPPSQTTILQETERAIRTEHQTGGRCDIPLAAYDLSKQQKEHEAGKVELDLKTALMTAKSLVTLFFRRAVFEDETIHEEYTIHNAVKQAIKELIASFSSQKTAEAKMIAAVLKITEHFSTFKPYHLIEETQPLITDNGTTYNLTADDLVGLDEIACAVCLVNPWARRLKLKLKDREVIIDLDEFYKQRLIENVSWYLWRFFRNSASQSDTALVSKEAA